MTPRCQLCGVKVLELSENLDKYISHLESEIRRLTQLLDDIREDHPVELSHQSESGR